MSDKERHTIQCDGRGGILEMVDDRPLSHRLVVGGQEVGVSNGARRHIAEQLGLAPSDGRAVPEGVEWPMVDGEPVVPGDVLWDGGGRRVTVDTVQCTVDRSGSAHCISALYESGTFSPFYKTGAYTRTEPPKPVLDRDGVPIEVGDTVYWVGGAGAQLKVVDVRSSVLQIHIETENGLRGAAAPTSLTHKRPLETADDNLIELTAKRDLKPERLHAERPDSWGRIEADMVKCCCEYIGYEGIGCDECAYFDRDAWECVGEKRMAADIVRRAKALAGVVGDE